MAGEGSLQNYFKDQCALRGILWRKIKFEGRRGGPDTLIAKHGRAVFIELKNPNKRGRLSSLQDRQIMHMTDVGLDVRVIDSREGIDNVIGEFAGGQNVNGKRYQRHSTKRH